MLPNLIYKSHKINTNGEILEKGFMIVRESKAGTRSFFSTYRDLGEAAEEQFHSEQEDERIRLECGESMRVFCHRNRTFLLEPIDGGEISKYLFEHNLCYLDDIMNR